MFPFFISYRLKKITISLTILFIFSLRPYTYAEAPDTFNAVLIGTGIPIPNQARACAATLIIAGDKKFLVDSGRGSFMSLVKYAHQDIDHVLFTHFHNDHIADYGEILVNRAIRGATEPMPVLGPAGTKQITNELLAAYRADTEYRVAHHGEKYSANAMTANVTEKDSGVIYDADGLVITIFSVDHHPIEPAVGYRFDYQGKSIVISGDTKMTPKLTEMSKDCDILVCEAMNTTILKGVLKGIQRSNPRQAKMLEELMEYHIDRNDVAKIARDANVKKVVLTHLVPSIPPVDAAEKNFVRGMSDIYQGEIIMGRDGMSISP